jgi:hypothetical protein
MQRKRDPKKKVSPERRTASFSVNAKEVLSMSLPVEE